LYPKKSVDTQEKKGMIMKMNRIFNVVFAASLSLLVMSVVDVRAEGNAKKTRTHHAKSADGADRSATRDPGVNARQDNQHDRIERGRHSGQLTKEESKELAETQKDIRQKEKDYKSDGVLTKDERKDLQQDLNAASKEIYSEKHDAETRSGVTPAQPGKAATRDPGVNARQENQQDRIAQGVKSGELTAKEARVLKAKEARVAALEKRMKSDGSLTAEERARLQKQLDNLSADIYKQKHDNQEQPKAE
jgi:hypothetical protein